MTPADLRAWQTQLGHTYDTAAVAMGVSRATYARLVAGPGDVPLTTALSCAALAAGLGPWVPPVTPEQSVHLSVGDTTVIQHTVFTRESTP